MDNTGLLRNILTVSELTAQIKTLLEDRFSLVWLSGEISNFRMPASGHFYFSLKDEQAQINSVMFRGQNVHLKFEPEDGMQINGLGRVSLYEPRGSYQIILEYMEPSGVGALQVAFEQLKAQLAQEGLFDQKHKRPIPFIPRRIGVITSPTGAVIHDILRVLNHRFPNVQVEIIAVKVQGDGAESDIIRAIYLLNQRSSSDVAILARGGGSLEDLMAFNSEGVARAIFASTIPIISAVGHETDYTLADFVADVRMPTPSAAAEIVVPLKIELQEKWLNLKRKLLIAFVNYIRLNRARLAETAGRLVDPRKRIQDLRLRTDDLSGRLLRAMMQDLRLRRERLGWEIEKLRLSSPAQVISKLKNKLEINNFNLLYLYDNFFSKKRSHLMKQSTKLQALSPIAILERGYSITRTVPDARIVRNASHVKAGATLEILLAKGRLHVHVDSGGGEPQSLKRKDIDGQTDF